MSESTWKKGQEDKAKGKGPLPENAFTNDKDRKDYQAGYQKK